jgi:hypothetical protein
MLSPQLLVLLRDYWWVAKPSTPARNTEQPVVVVLVVVADMWLKKTGSAQKMRPRSVPPQSSRNSPGSQHV